MFFRSPKVEIYEYGILPDKFYFIPWNGTVAPLPHYTEESRSAVYDQRSYLSRAGIYLEVVDEAYTAAVLPAYDFLASERRKTTVHNNSLIDF